VTIESPPTPPAVVWEVWGYKWEGNQFVKQADHCLRTTDLKQAIDYNKEILRFQYWTVRDNLPASCIDENPISRRLVRCNFRLNRLRSSLRSGPSTESTGSGEGRKVLLDLRR